jgi:hypothetical protein
MANTPREGETAMAGWQWEADIFAEGMDRWNQTDPVQEIAFCTRCTLAGHQIANGLALPIFLARLTGWL